MSVLLTASVHAQRNDEELADFFGKKGKSDEPGLMPSFFTKKEAPAKKKERSFLPDFYAKIVTKAADHNQLPSFFNVALKKEKERTQQPDFFSSGIFNRERTQQPDHFSKEVGRAKKRGLQSDHFSNAVGKPKKRGLQQDHFSSGVSEKEHAEEDLQLKARPRKRYRKNFIGERFRLFNSDPNRKKKKAEKKQDKPKDPFGRKAKKMDQPQNPKGQMDLFDGGVLPKMKDLR